MSRLIFRPLSATPVSGWDDFFGTAKVEPAAWLADLGARSGAYVIRDADSHRVLYVGESHTGKLRRTLLRHFQAWTGKTAGPTFDRGAVEVAIVVCPAARAVGVQNKLIARFGPDRNVYGKADTAADDSAPW
jgi:hypothetical protein